MKKLFTLGVLLLSLIIGVSCSNNASSNNNSSEQSEESNVHTNYQYSVENFDSLPDDWALYSLSDTTKTTTTYENGEMKIHHNNPNISNKFYFGSVYEVGNNKKWSDFTFEVTFKANSYDNTSRFIAILYRTSYLGDNLMGYGMNYRYSGESAVTVADFTGKFTDDEKITNLPSLTNKDYHTIKIEMVGNNAKHYIDNQLITEYDVTTKTSLLGGLNNEGGISLIVNRSSINIKSVKISGTMIEGATHTSNNTLASTYVQENSLVNPSTVVCDATSLEIFNSSISNSKKPSNMILHIDDKMNVVDDSNNIISSLDDALASLDNKIIPIIYLDDTNETNKLLSYLADNYILDMAVMSKDHSLIKIIRDKYSHIRAILDIEDLDDSYVAIKNAQTVGAATIALSQKDASLDNVNYIQSMLKTVWVKLNSSNSFDVNQSFASGAYGLICDNPSAVYSIFESMDPNTSVRSSFAIAHRGVVTTYNENSLKGLRASIEGGATHVELDVKVTTDNELVLMHDDTIDRTTNGKGTIENMTFEEVSKYILDEVSYEEIPTLDQAVEIIIESDIIFVLEIKTNKTRCIDVLKQKIENDERYQELLDQLVLIAFDNSQLAYAKEQLPYIPTASLNNASSDTFSTVLQWVGLYNTVVNTSNGYSNKEFHEQYLRDRGLACWFWTFANNSAVDTAIKNGVVGITTNVPLYFNSKIRTVEISQDETLVTPAIGDKINVVVTTYEGIKTVGEGEIISVNEDETKLEALAKYTTEDGKVYITQALTIQKEVKENKPNNVGLIIGLICGGLVLAGASVATVVIIKRKKTK